jgi:hypothetical protein
VVDVGDYGNIPYFDESCIVFVPFTCRLPQRRTVFLKIYIITTFDKRGYITKETASQKIKPPLRRPRIITNTAISVLCFSADLRSA